jgi:hypothetical protein
MNCSVKNDPNSKGSVETVSSDAGRPMPEGKSVKLQMLQGVKGQSTATVVRRRQPSKTSTDFSVAVQI